MSVESIAEEASRRSGMGRRGFLASAGAFSAAAFLVACGSSDKSSSSSGSKSTTTGATSDTTMGGDTTTTTSGDTRSAENDLKTAAFAAGVEFLAVATYKAALDAATANKLGAVPPAVAEYVKTAMGHHKAALDAWNQILTSNGQKAVNEAPAALAKSVNDEFAKVKDVGGAAKLALGLEQAAAATYLKAIPTLVVPAAIKLAPSIQIIDMQHVAILNFALGQYPVPDTFAGTDKALAPA
jgi:hypothetical protein